LGFCRLVEVILVVARQSDVVLVVLVVTWRRVKAVGVGHTRSLYKCWYSKKEKENTYQEAVRLEPLLGSLGAMLVVMW
jgi:hypothetical protein